MSNMFDLYITTLYSCMLESMHSKNAIYYRDHYGIEFSESDISSIEKIYFIRHLIFFIAISVGYILHTIIAIMISFGIACIVSFVPYLVFSYIIYSRIKGRR